MFLLLLLLFPVLAAADEFDEREAAITTAQALYQAESFDALDRLLEKLLHEQSRTPSGLWLSGLVHMGMHDFGARPHNEAEWLAQRERAQRWLAKRPQSEQARFDLANTAFEHARALGCGQCTVLDEAQRPALFAAALQRAQQQFEVARRQGVSDPHYFAQMLLLAQLQERPPEAIEPLLAELAQQAPGYYPAWFGAVDFYKGRDPAHARERIEALARRAMQASAATEGKSMYARIWWYAAQSGFDPFAAKGADWTLFDAAFRDVMSRYPDDWNRNNYASFACQSGHAERARELMFGHEPLPQAWDSQEQFEACIPPTLDA
jgi:hypothetical protein